MATHLDLEEQEQLDAVKQFWKRYGNLVTWLLIVALVAYSGWTGWNWWQREQATQASAMFDELDKAAQAADADKVASVFGDLKSRYPKTAFAQQGGLLAAKVQAEKGQIDAAQATLDWVAANAGEAEYQTIARLRLAGLLLDNKKPDEALKQLDAATAAGFEALVADRRGDVLMAQGKADDAKASYTKAWQAMDAKIEYRQLVEAKLTALGAAPAASAAEAAAPTGAGK
ncbi:MAG: tetratricopeptide repeat protein [Burkholderiaceae bacterium]|nr:tetratricopeptide repeat protein [Burkholderiaceae bacterium]